VPDRLSALWRRKRTLSADIIKAAKSVPHPTVYVRRFGSLTETYKRIGFRPEPATGSQRLQPRLKPLFTRSRTKLYQAFRGVGDEPRSSANSICLR
jgi:hypothetical protein